MKKTILFIYLLLTGLFCQAFGKTILNDKSILWTYLSKMQTYRATFHQVTQDEEGHVIQQSQGEMALRRPGYLKWETFSPTHQQIFVNKSIVWIYDVDLEQASRNTLNADTTNPGILLSNSPAQLKQQFIVDSMNTQRDRLCFTLHPKQTSRHESVIKITLCFKHSVLQSLTLNQNLGEKTQFVFSNIRLNQAIAISLFRFAPHNNVQILN